MYAARAKGARFWDIDGFEYIDWISGIGSISLGYADPIVYEAVREQISTGTVYSVNHELEVELAEELRRSIPCAEMVRYAKCGGEACAIAFRIARGVTGRDKVCFCGYHGWHGWYLAANLAEEASLNAHLFRGSSRSVGREPLPARRCRSRRETSRHWVSCWTSIGTKSRRSSWSRSVPRFRRTATWPEWGGWFASAVRSSFWMKSRPGCVTAREGRNSIWGSHPTWRSSQSRCGTATRWRWSSAAVT